MKSDDITNLLWTGGWDSTFRLLYLLLVKEKAVQPYYIIDSDRLSTGLELRTMKDIKQRLFAEYPKIQNLLLPTQYKELHDIQPNKNITQSFKRIRNNHFMGSQYDWLPRFAHEAGIKDMELAVHRDDKAHKIVKLYVIQSGIEKDSSYEVDRKFEGSDEYSLFKYFRFPIFNLRKVDMQIISRNKGFYDYMELTWFCHRPRANGTPCGVCNPCIYTMEEGTRLAAAFC